MKPNQTGFIICILLAVVTGLILFVESKRPIYVEVSMDKIHKEMCNAESNNKEKKSYEEKATYPISKDYDKEKEKGDLNE